MTEQHEQGGIPHWPLTPAEIAEQLALHETVRANPETLHRLARHIGSVIREAATANNYILPRSDHYVEAQLRDGSGTVLFGRDAAGELDFHYYWGVIPLVKTDRFATYPVCEGGSLVANPKRGDLPGWEQYRAQDVIVLSRQRPSPVGGLVISTSRSKPSKRALAGSGATQLPRQHYPMLDALTCDPGCLPGSDGRVAGVGNVQHDVAGCSDCIACPVSSAYGGHEIADGCYLYADDPVRAAHIEQQLHEAFGGSALRVRSGILNEE